MSKHWSQYQTEFATYFASEEVQNAAKKQLNYSLKPIGYFLLVTEAPTPSVRT